MKEIIKILQNYKFIKKEFFFFVFFGLLMETLYVFIPQFSKIIIGIIEQGGKIEELYKWLILFVLFVSISIFIGFLWEYFLEKSFLNLYTRKNLSYREKLLNKNYKQLIDVGTGKLIKRLSDGVHSEVDIFFSISNIFISAVYRGLLVVCILAFYIPKMIFVVVIGIGVLFGFNYFIRGYIKKYTKKEQKLWEKDGRNGARFIMENFTIRLYNKGKYELKKGNEVLSQIPFYGIKVNVANMAFYKTLEYILRLLEISVFLFLGTLILKTGDYSIAYLTMIIIYIWLLWWPLDKAIHNLNQINRLWEKYSKLQRFVEEPNTITNGKKTYIYKNGSIKLKNINFGYSKKVQIFKDLNITFLAGKKNALVGHSGGGKSTITKLLLRLYDIDSGKILLDGQEIKSLDINTFYSQIGYLPQEPAIFDGTIRENMEYAFSKKRRNQDTLIWDALKKARIDEMIKKLEKGLDTEVGEKGIKLSGGEKQRLAIARIFLKNPEIIMLDEPTSALDSISESKVGKALDQLVEGRTSIIIAHRLQTVMHSDKIIVIEDGKIEAEGKHSELIKKSKIYKSLVDLQSGTIIE